MVSFTSASEVQRAGIALAALTSLRHLQLSVEGAEEWGGAAALLQSLQGLTRLEHCDLCLVGHGPDFMHLGSAGLQHLPASLTSLGLLVRPGLHSDQLEGFMCDGGRCEIQAMLEGGGLDTEAGVREFGEAYPSNPQPPMNLGHLAALKELPPASNDKPKDWIRLASGGAALLELSIRAGDVLPPNLTRLELDADSRSLAGLLRGPLAAPTVAPLTSLTRLEVLKVFSCRAPARQLRQLAAALMPPRDALKAVSLDYPNAVAACRAAPAWRLLPVVG